MKQNYCGKSWEHGTDIQKLIDAGVEVYWRRCWQTYDGHEECREYDEAWHKCEKETDYLKPRDFRREKVNAIMSRTLVSYTEIAYQIPDQLYPVLQARENEEKARRKRELDDHFERVKARPVPDWAWGLSECEEGYLYENEIAPEKNHYDDRCMDIDGNYVGYRNF